MREDQKLINWAKTQLPDPEQYVAPYCAPIHFESKQKFVFKRKQKSFQGCLIWVWEFIEVRPMGEIKRRYEPLLY